MVKALNGCNPENSHVRKLISVNPLCEDLFHNKIIKRVSAQALHQAKLVSMILEFSQTVKETYVRVMT